MKILKLFNDQESGAVALIAAFVLPVLIGMIGLGVEVGMWYNYKRLMQNAADAAAIGGAIELANGSTSTVVKARAQSDVARNKFIISGVVATSTVNVPPATGPNTANASAVEVLLTYKPPRIFSQYFSSTTLTINVRAVAQAPIGSKDPCLLITGGTPAISSTGSGSITMPNCGIAVNGAISPNITAGSGGSISASFIRTTTTTQTTGTGTITAPSGIITNAAATADPYASLTMPTPGGCLQNNYNPSGNTTNNPGTYCNGINVRTGTTLTLRTGTYIIDRGTFKMNGTGKVVVQAGGATIILTSRSGSNYAILDLSTMTSNGSFVITAPTTGIYSGLAIWGNPNISPGASLLPGTIAPTINGSLYLPNQGGNGSLTINGCYQFIVETLPLNGNSVIGTGMLSTCKYYKASSIAGGVGLLE